MTGFNTDIHTNTHIHNHKYMQSWFDEDGEEHLGGTALHTAVDQQHEEVVEVLLKANADPDLLQKVITQSPYIIVKSCYCTKPKEVL